MTKTTWFLMKISMVGGTALFNAVRIVNGHAMPCEEPPTPHEHEARSRVKRMNNHEALMSVALQQAFGGGGE